MATTHDLYSSACNRCRSLRSTVSVVCFILLVFGPSSLSAQDMKKVLAGQKLSPVLVAEGDIADGYHRVSLAYALDPYADVPLKLG